MKERILLGPEETLMLKEPDRLMDSTRRKRIIDKVGQYFATLDFIARYDKIPFDKLWKEQISTINSFLAKLIRYDSTNIAIDKNLKLMIAGNLINLGLEYYTNAFKSSKFFEKKIKEVRELVTAINEINQKDETDKKYSLLYTMRREKFPPNLRDVGSDTDYKSYCVLCFNWASGKDKKQSMKNIRHHTHCYYIKKYPEFTTCTLEPSK